MKFSELLFGRPLATDQAQHERIGTASGVAILGLDALSSAAYGPEAALTVLVPIGAIATAYVTPITVAIIAILVLLCLSYWQTIGAYADGGGSYTVAKQNLGQFPGLLAASALSTDYILNVAVAISAGVGAIVSAVPPLMPYTVPLCLSILVVLTVVNLRGVRTAGLLFMAPTFAFVGCLGATIVIGVFKTIAGTAAAGVEARAPAPVTTVGAWLLLRAFASGCTAMTGVEATSNAVPLFRDPRVPLARRTLVIIVSILAVLLIGIAWLSRTYRIVAMPPGGPGYQTVLSQMVDAIAGRGAFYYVTMSVVLAERRFGSDASVIADRRRAAATTGSPESKGAAICRNGFVRDLCGSGARGRTRNRGPDA